MKKILLAIAATTASICILFPIQSVRAASLGLTVTENWTDNTTKVPGIPNLYFLKNLVRAEGKITSIDGFSSLQGVNPSSLTLNYGGLELLSYKNENGILSATAGKSGSKTPYFNLLENGQVIATSDDITIESTTNAIAGSPKYGEGTQNIKITLNGVIGNPFFQEIQNLTNGTGILELNLGTATGIKPAYYIGTTATASFTYTGGTLVASTPKSTSIPEPGAVGGLLAIGTGLLLKRRGKLEDINL